MSVGIATHKKQLCGKVQSNRNTPECTTVKIDKLWQACKSAEISSILLNSTGAYYRISNATITTIMEKRFRRVKQDEQAGRIS